MPRLGVDEPLDDLPVDVLDAICRLVHVVEVDGAVGTTDAAGWRRVPEDGPTAVEQVPGPDGDQVRPRRSGRPGAAPVDRRASWGGRSAR